MNFDLAAGRDPATSLSIWTLYAVLAFGFAGGCWMLVSMLVDGPNTRAIMESQRAEEIKQEDQEHCTRLGMPPDTGAFVACTNELALVRQRHDERLHRDLQYP